MCKFKCLKYWTRAGKVYQAFCSTCLKIALFLTYESSSHRSQNEGKRMRLWQANQKCCERSWPKVWSNVFLVVDGSSLNARLDKKFDSLELSLRPQKIWVWNSVAGHKCESIFLVVNLPSLRLGASKSRLPFPRPKFPKKCGHSSVLWCVTKLLCCQSPPLPPHVRYKKCEYIFKLFLCDAAACWIFKTPMLIIPNP